MVPRTGLGDALGDLFAEMVYWIEMRLCRIERYRCHWVTVNYLRYKEEDPEVNEMILASLTQQSKDRD